MASSFPSSHARVDALMWNYERETTKRYHGDSNNHSGIGPREYYQSAYLASGIFVEINLLEKALELLQSPGLSLHILPQSAMIQRIPQRRYLWY
jgi:hypothetical protein